MVDKSAELNLLTRTAVSPVVSSIFMSPACVLRCDGALLNSTSPHLLVGILVYLFMSTFPTL